MAKRYKGVMGETEIDIHETGRIDVYSKSGGGLFGKDDKGEERHSHVVIDSNNDTQYYRDEGGSTLKDTGVYVPKDKTS